MQEKTISSNKYEEVIKLKAHAAAVIARLCSTQDGCDQVVACEGVSCLVGLLFHENSVIESYAYYLFLPYIDYVINFRLSLHFYFGVDSCPE